MKVTDARVGGWDLTATAGATLSLTSTWVDDAGAPVVLGAVSFWVGGSASPDPTDLSDAVEHVATVVANVASVSLAVPSDVRSTPLRVTIDGTLFVNGRLLPSTLGSSSSSQAVTVRTDPLEVTIVTTGPPGPAGNLPVGGTTGQALVKASDVDLDVEWGDVSGGGGVDSVNGQTGAVVLDYTDVGAASAAQGGTADTALQPGDGLAAIDSAAASKLDGIEAGADVTDAANVAAAGAVMALSTVTKLYGPITQAAYDLLTPASDVVYIVVG